MSAAACHLGIGAILYLQILKTFVILFIVLTLINIPIIGLYANSSKTNMTNFEEVFAYFTLGNLGRGEDHCGYTVLSGGSRKTQRLRARRKTLKRAGTGGTISLSCTLLLVLLRLLRLTAFAICLLLTFGCSRITLISTSWQLNSLLASKLLKSHGAGHSY